MEILLPILFVALVVFGIVYSAIAAKKRREAMQRLAAALGLAYHPQRDHAFDERYPFLKHLGRGSNRYAFNRLSGNYGGHDVLAFDYHYETYSRSSKGRRRTHHHYFSFFLLHLPASFPELTITREGLLSKIAQFAGYDDIDFESAEFSRKFCVRSTDKKFAYDICHPQAIEFLLRNDDVNIEIDRHCLSLFFSRRLSPQQIEPQLRRLIAFRELFPDYLWPTNMRA